MLYYPQLAKPGTPDVLGLTRYQYEYKLNGIRAIIYVDGGTCSIMSRSGRDMTAQFPEIARVFNRDMALKLHVFDGEIVSFDNDGLEDFQALSTRTQRKENIAEQAAKHYAQFIAFDLLVDHGVEILDLPLSQRRVLLAGKDAFWQFDTSTLIHPAHAQNAYDNLGAREGLMAKLLTSPYRHGERSDEWLKIKPWREIEIRVGGCTWGIGKRANDFAALIVGTDNAKGELVYCGNVGTGFSNELLHDLRILIQDNEQEESPFKDYPTTHSQAVEVRHYCKPELRAVIAYQEKTRDGKLRFPSFRRLVID